MTLAHSRLERTEHVYQTSCLYTLIPTIVRNRIAPLRKIISAYSLGLHSQATNVVMHRRAESEEVHIVTGEPAPESNFDIRRKNARHGTI